MVKDALPEISDLDALLAQMTMTITDTAAAADLQQMALAALSPELRALAEELGLFGLRVDANGQSSGGTGANVHLRRFCGLAYQTFVTGLLRHQKALRL